MFTITTNSPEQTSLLGEKIANLIQDNLIICLEGDLGAGKLYLHKVYVKL